MSLTMAELGAFAAGVSGLGAGQPTSWAEWYAAQTVPEYYGSRPSGIPAGTGISLRPGEASATLAWRKAIAAEKAAGIRGPASTSSGPRQFQQRLAYQSALAKRREAAKARKEAARAASARRAKANAAARSKSAADRQARQAKADAAAQAKRAQYAKELKALQKPVPKSWTTPRVTQSRYVSPASTAAYLIPGGGDPLLALQQKNRALFEARRGAGGTVFGPTTAVSIGGLSGLG